MANTYYAVDGTLGVELSSGASSSQEFPLKTVAQLNANRQAIYTVAKVAITVSSGSGEPLHLAAAGTASTSAGGFFAYQTFAAGEFGWVLASAPTVPVP
jgi:hypothetical protein